MTTPLSTCAKKPAVPAACRERRTGLVAWSLGLAIAVTGCCAILVQEQAPVPAPAGGVQWLQPEEP